MEIENEKKKTKKEIGDWGLGVFFFFFSSNVYRLRIRFQAFEEFSSISFALVGWFGNSFVFCLVLS